jgi:MSHA biogenesis protein MshL
MKLTTLKTIKFNKQKKLFPVLLMVGILSQITGCGTMPRTVHEPTITAGGVAAATGLQENPGPIVDIDAGYDPKDMFMIREMDKGGDLPKKIITPFTLNESGVYDSMRILLAGTGMTLKVDGGVHGGEQYGVVTMFDVQGQLSDVIDELSQSMGFFYSVRKKTLLIQQDRQFVVALPPAMGDDNTAYLTNTLQFMGAKDPYIDRMTRSLIFRANRTSFEKIEEYLNNIRNTRSMIVYSINIFQVDLNDSQDTGIQWNKLGWATGAGAATTNVATTTAGATTAATTSARSAGKSAQGAISGLGLGLVLSASNFSVDMLVNYLKTQGTVQTLSQPQISVMSGSNASLSVGRTQTYVSKVGTTFSTALSQLTTETKDLKTGVSLSLHADYSDNTVYTNLDMQISDLVKLTPFLALGTSLVLPETIDRQLNSIIRSRPGDMILLGGITISRDAREDNRGVANNGTSKSVLKSELVLAMRTKIVNFLPKKEGVVRDSLKQTPKEKMPVADAVKQVDSSLPMGVAVPMVPEFRDNGLVINTVEMNLPFKGQ